MKKTLFGVTGTVLFAMMVAGSSAEATTIFSYSGTVDDYTVPVTGIYLIAAARCRAAGNTEPVVGVPWSAANFAQRRHAVADRGGRCALARKRYRQPMGGGRRRWQFRLLPGRVPAPISRRRRRRCRVLWLWRRRRRHSRYRRRARARGTQWQWGSRRVRWQRRLLLALFGICSASGRWRRWRRLGRQRSRWKRSRVRKWRLRSGCRFQRRHRRSRRYNFQWWFRLRWRRGLARRWWRGRFFGRRGWYRTTRLPSRQ